MWIGEREITMPKGWAVQYKNGEVFCEEDISWAKLPNKRDIARVILKWEDRFWELSGKDNYAVPMKRGYIDSRGLQGTQSRAIGFYDVDGRCKVYLRVEEDTGVMKWEYAPF